jgi:nucleoside 2-deoxyribosyltransferase
VRELEARVPASEVFDRDVSWIMSCEAVIAEVSVPSHGVGFEIGLAIGAGKPVLCLWQEGRRVSKMITGNPHPDLQRRAYKDAQQAIQLARDFVAGVSQAKTP